MGQLERECARTSLVDECDMERVRARQGISGQTRERPSHRCRSLFVGCGKASSDEPLAEFPARASRV